MHRAPLLLLLVVPAIASAQPATPFEPGSPRATVESLAKAMTDGDGATIRSILYAKGDAEQKMVDAMVAMSESIARLRPIAAKRYGEVSGRVVTGDPAAAAVDQHAKLEGAYQQVDGDTARLTFADPAADPVVLRRVDGRWRVPVADKAAKVPEAELQTRAADLMLAASVIDEVAALCEGGKWQTANDVASAIQERILEAQQELIPATTQPATKPATTKPAAAKAGAPTGN